MATTQQPLHEMRSLLLSGNGSLAALSSFQGIDSGFSGGTDDMYTVYDKPWRAGTGLAEKIYRPTRSAADKDIYGDDVEKLLKTNRYV